MLADVGKSRGLSFCIFYIFNLQRNLYKELQTAELVHNQSFCSATKSTTFYPHFLDLERFRVLNLTKYPQVWEKKLFTCSTRSKAQSQQWERCLCKHTLCKVSKRISKDSLQVNKIYDPYLAGWVSSLWALIRVVLYMAIVSHKMRPYDFSPNTRWLPHLRRNSFPQDSAEFSKRWLSNRRKKLRQRCLAL